MRSGERRQRRDVQEVYGVPGNMLGDSADIGYQPEGRSARPQSVDRVTLMRHQPHTAVTTTSSEAEMINQDARCSNDPIASQGRPVVVDPQYQNHAQLARRRSRKRSLSSTTSSLTTDDLTTTNTSPTRRTYKSLARSHPVIHGLSASPLTTLPLRLRGGGSTVNVTGLGNGGNAPRSASTSVSVSSEHDAVEQTNRDSTTSSSSYDMNQYQAFLASGGIAQQQQHQVTVRAPTQSSSSTQSAQSSTHSGHVVMGAPSNGGNPYQPVPLAMPHQTVPTGYTVSRLPGVPYQQPQHVGTHSRHPQQTARAYSVSDSATSSGTSYNDYQGGTNGGDRGATAVGGSKGKGKAVDDDDSASKLIRVMSIGIILTQVTFLP